MMHFACDGLHKKEFYGYENVTLNLLIFCEKYTKYTIIPLTTTQVTELNICILMLMLIFPTTLLTHE